MYSQGQNFNNQFSMQPQNMSGMQGAAMPSAAMPAQLNKKLNLPWILVIAEAAIILILGIILMIPKGNNKGRVSLSGGDADVIELNHSGEVESFAVLCETPDYYISFDRDNHYYIEKKEAPEVTEEESDEYLDLFVEKGNYTVDGTEIHLKPNADENYYAKYDSHKLTYKEVNYDCKNNY